MCADLDSKYSVLMRNGSFSLESRERNTQDKSSCSERRSRQSENPITVYRSNFQTLEDTTETPREQTKYGSLFEMVGLTQLFLSKLPTRVDCRSSRKLQKVSCCVGRPLDDQRPKPKASAIPTPDEVGCPGLYRP